MPPSLLRVLVLPIPIVLGLSNFGCDDFGKGDTGTDDAATPLTGFIGAPCQTDADCPYSGGFCLPAARGMPDGRR